jgi:hypothetical protein
MATGLTEATDPHRTTADASTAGVVVYHSDRSRQGSAELRRMLSLSSKRFTIVSHLRQHALHHGCPTSTPPCLSRTTTTTPIASPYSDTLSSVLSALVPPTCAPLAACRPQLITGTSDQWCVAPPAPTLLMPCSLPRRHSQAVVIDVTRADCRTIKRVPGNRWLQATAHKVSLSIGYNIDRITSAAYTFLIE